MLLLEAYHIKKYYGDRLILAFEELKLYQGDRIGIVGLNGAGKTTLMQLLSGDIPPDGGIVKRHCEIAYLKQFSEDETEAERKLLKELKVEAKGKSRTASGGEKARLKIAGALSRGSPVLFADEPTANLDFQGVSYLKEKLSQAETLLIISHDRSLLDALCTGIIEVREGALYFYPGNYSAYDEQRKSIAKRQQAEYEGYTAARDKLTRAVAERRQLAGAMNKAPARMGSSEARLHKGKIKEKRKKIDSAVRAIQSRLEQLEEKEKPKEPPQIKLDFSLTDPPRNKIVVSADHLSFSYGGNILFQEASFSLYNGMKTALAGGNGSGKTTLLNLIAGNHPSVYKVPKAVIGTFYQGFENLDGSLTVLENVSSGSVQSETTVRTILSRLLIAGDDVYKPVSVLSGGEKIRTAFAKLFVSGANILLLDEPTNYLDIPSIEALQAILREYGGTVLFVSHDKAFTDAVADRLILIEDKKLREFEGNLHSYQESLRGGNGAQTAEMRKTMLRMRMSDLIARLAAAPPPEKERLEQEYGELARQLRALP